MTPNTDTLSLFFLFALMVEVLAAISVVVPIKGAAQFVEIALALAGAVISGWCIVRLRSEAQMTEPSRALKP